MDDDVAKILGGTIGKYWAQRDSDLPSLDAEPISGVAQLRPDGILELKGLTEDALRSFFRPDGDYVDAPDYFLASTEHGGILLDGVSQAGGSFTIGGLTASTARYEIESFVHGLNFAHLRGREFTSVSTHWNGIAEWAGLSAMTYDEQRDDDGRVKALALHIEAPEPLSVKIDDDLSLRLGSTWFVDGPSDHRQVRTPTEATVVSEGGSRLGILLLLQLRIQDIFCLAHEGHIAATGGLARISEGRDSGLGGILWNRQIMSERAGIAKADTGKLSLFDLVDIDGVTGLKAWLDLSGLHPRLVRPISGRFHVGRQFAEQILVDVGAAIEYWWGVNRKDPSRPWATESFQPLAVAQSIGPAFSGWVGDVQRWAEQFWENYNNLKHYNPKYIHDPTSVHVLALSGLSLMTAVALQEITAPGSSICSRLFAGFRWQGRGEAVRELICRS